MRITNSMITLHSQNNINTTKGLVDTYNDQMTSQKKISKPSDDPVVAIRSLRLRDSLNEVEQYTDKNIPDAESWLEVTETSLSNMSNILNDIYTACVNSATGTLTTDDRNTLLKNLSACVEQLYAEGNSDYAGRTVFTGYKTNKTLTFETDTPNATYEITQKLDINALTSKNFYTNTLEVPKNWTDGTSGLDQGYPLEDQMEQVTVDRIRLAYSKTDENTTPEIKIPTHVSDGNGTFHVEMLSITRDPGGISWYVDENGVTQNAIRTVSYSDWEEEGFEVQENAVYYIPESGELVFGSDIAKELKTYAKEWPDWSMEITYDKTGFTKGEVRPEMYFDCTDKTIAGSEVTYTREEQDIAYTISANQDLKVNTQAGENGILSTAIARDVQELMDAITAAQNANDKVDQIKALKNNTEYSSEEDQAILDQWLEAANKEKTYLEDNLKNLFSRGITEFQNYKQVVDLAKTDVGSRDSRLELTKTRMTTHKSTIKTLIKDNEDREMSDILIDFKSAYTAYESALKAASQANDMTLLDYL